MWETNNKQNLILEMKGKAMFDEATEEGIRNGYYCLAIAIIKGCSIEKAIALYEGRTMWITPDIISEMIELNKEFKISEISEMYSLDPHQVRFYLKKAGAFTSSRKSKKKDNEVDDEIDEEYVE